MTTTISSQATHSHEAAAVYAIGRMGTAKPRPSNPFAGTIDVTLPQRTRSPGIDVFAATARRVVRYFDEAAETAVYLIGRAAHPTLQGDALLQWCGQAVKGDVDGFKNLPAPFVLLVDDRQRRRVYFVSDSLGLQPWFTGSFGGQLVGGTHVLGICEAGLSTGEVDYDTVASWLSYSFVCTEGSVAKDYRRLPAHAVSEFDPCGCKAGQAAYATLKYVRQVLPPDDLVAATYQRAGESFDVLTRGLDEVNLPLSGGYDSRLLCALAAERGLRARMTVVESLPQETVNARAVAAAFGLPLDTLPMGPSKIDLFDDPLYFMAEGFPVPRNLTNAVARLYPGMPVVSGFMGDGVMRGALSAGYAAYLAMDDAGLDDQALARTVHDRICQPTNRLHLLRDPIKDRALARAQAALLPVIAEGRVAGRPLAYAGLRLSQCRYFSNIVLSHQDVADALVPYCSWELVQFNAAHNGSFASDTYDRLFRRFFPCLKNIPHSTKVAVHAAAPAACNIQPTRHLRRWANEMLRAVPAKWCHTAVTPKKLFKRLLGGLLVENGKHVDELGYLHRIHAFEERAKRANLNLNWARL